MTNKPQEVLLAMDSATHFNKMVTLMCKDSPPDVEDAPMLANMAKISLELCKPFDPNTLDSTMQAALKDLSKTVLADIEKKSAEQGCGGLYPTH